MNEHDPYWQIDLSLGDSVFSTELPSSRVRRGIRILLHVGTERYFGRQEIVPITQPEGDLTSLHARAYTLVSHGLSRRLPVLGTLLRGVTKANWEQMDSQTLGDCHAWYYHQDRLLVLWDCLVSEHATDPKADRILCAVWNGFEQVLRALFPDTCWIATPSWEPVYEPKDWQAFLTKQGYAPFNTQAFLKEVHRR